PDADYAGSDSFTYTVEDPAGAADTATVEVVVREVNDAPVAVDDAVTTDEDTPVVVDPRANDTDVDGDPITIVAVDPPVSGSLLGLPDGTLRYVPDPDTNGTEILTYRISDGRGGTASATLRITVRPVNDPPVAGDDTLAVTEDTPRSGSVAANDGDVDGDALTWSVTEEPTLGRVDLDSDTGDILFTPLPDVVGVDQFRYRVTDPLGETATATVRVVIGAVNDPPVAHDDRWTTAEDEPVSGDPAADDTDVDGDVLTVVAVGDPAHGTATVGPDGRVTYTPDPDVSGSDEFTYVVTDPAGATDTGLVTVTITPVGDPPVAVDDEATTDEDTPVVIDVLADDSDPDGDPLTIGEVDPPEHGTATVTADGRIRYTPDPDHNGSDEFEYHVVDPTGLEAEAEVRVEIRPVPDAPVVDDRTVTGPEDTVLTARLTAVDPDEGDELTFRLLDPPAAGELTVAPDGTLRYVPVPDAHGTWTATVEVSDGDLTDTALVTLVVEPVDDPPVAVDDATTTDEDVAVTIDVLANDTDVDGDPLTVAAVGTPTRGSAAIDADGRITYTPDPDVSGIDTFTYTVDDGHGAHDTAVVTVEIVPVEDPPVAGDDGVATDEDTRLVFDPLVNDTDVDGDDLVITAVTQPDHGGVLIRRDGLLRYRPDRDFDGVDTFTYTVDDGHGGTDTATVTVAVGPVNDPPRA
ncbi:MAG: tandem-95 repeat protein, partial [Actinomyces sp.]